MPKKITVYSTPNCGYCVMAKEFFKANKIEYAEVDVSEDEDAAREMVRKSGQMGVPVIEIDNKVIVGFDRNAIKKVLGLK
ncbi:MAG: glutaredoxin family protein [Candidatus Nanoarchaeia archaeon]